jgi:hypothetical protein
MASVLSQPPTKMTGRGAFSLSHDTFGAPLEESSGVSGGRSCGQCAGHVFIIYSLRFLFISRWINYPATNKKKRREYLSI